MKKLYTLLLVCATLGFLNYAQAQVLDCESSVPYYTADLRGNPDSTWISPYEKRDGLCCLSSPHEQNDQCVSFEILLDENVGGISFDVYSGARPKGSLQYQISCGTQHSVKDTLCLTGVGPHYITFCKPGANANDYILKTYPKPTFPEEVYTRKGCVKTIDVLGLLDGSITWNSIYPGGSGDYNSLLSCTTCKTSDFTPISETPEYIEYVVCGSPLLTECGYVDVCDTIKVFTYDTLKLSADPNPATFCDNGIGSGVSVSLEAEGGDSNYTYFWTQNSTGDTISQADNFFIEIEDDYTLQVKDGLYSRQCPAFEINLPVQVAQNPVVFAGEDDTLCATNPQIILEGQYDENATGGEWIGGLGTFNPGRTYIPTTYTPHVDEISAGFVTLTFSSTGAGGGCFDASDDITIYFSPEIEITLNDLMLDCYGDDIELIPTVTGGMTPYSYNWSNNINTLNNTVYAGNYQFVATDLIGCNGTENVNVLTPSQIDLTLSSSNVTGIGNSDGTATVVAANGTPGYTYLWSNNNQTTSTATGLTYGIYTVTVQDSNGCQKAGSVVVSNPLCNGFNVSVSDTDVLCHGDSTGVAIASTGGGLTPINFIWNDAGAQTNATATGLAAGVYVVIATDATGCIQVGSTVISQPEVLNNILTHNDVTTSAGSDGNASSNPSGGKPAYQYEWSTTPLQIGQTATGLSVGVYELTLTDDNDCSLIDNVIISDVDCNGFRIAVNSSDVNCNDFSNGTASVLAINGEAPYAILWSTGSKNPVVSSLSAGNYTVTVTDNNKCMEISHFSISEPDQLSVGLVAQDMQCFESNDGTIDLTVNGGTYPYFYEWSNGKLSEDLIDLTNASYTVTVTDANNCKTTASSTVGQPEKLGFTITATDNSCFDGNNGTISLSPSGGISPYVFTWSDGTTTKNRTGLEAGYYVVTMTDANACQLSLLESVEVGEPDSLRIDSVHINCANPENGLALVDVFYSGGTTPSVYVSINAGSSYLFENIITAEVMSGATYPFSLKDQNNCLSESFEVVVDPIVEINTVNFDLCYPSGTVTTEVEAAVNGGDGGAYQVSFDNGLNYENAGILTKELAFNADYSIISKDSKGCLSDTILISLPDSLNINAAISSNYNGSQISCFGSSTGEISTLSTGGEGNYSFVWSNGETTAIIDDLGAGVYSVTVTDENSCFDMASISITEPTIVTITGVSVDTDYNGYGVDCFGSSTGSASAIGDGGTGVLSYAWSNGETTVAISGLNAGVYTVTVSDENNCSISSSLTITEPTPVETPEIAVTSDYNGFDIECFGSSTGSLSASATGGVSNYTFVWSNGETTSNISGLIAGTYSVTVTDENGCSNNSFVSITEPEVVSITDVSVTSNYNGYGVDCYGNSTGSASVSATGGTEIYTFIWSNGETNNSTSGLTAGTYSVTVSDENGCSASSSTTITEPTPVEVPTIAVTSDYTGFDIDCFGNSTGSLSVSTTGGVSGYTFSWSNGETSDNINGLAAGEYFVTVTDDNGCSNSSSISISEPEVVSITDISVTSDYNGYGVDCFGNSTASASVSGNGGTSIYSYVWSNGEMTPSISGLSAGIYSVTISDENDCNTSASITITEPTPVETPEIAVTSDYNGFDIECFGSSTGSLSASATGGVSNYTFVWSNGETTSNISGLIAGTYSVTVTDENGCSNNSFVSITEPEVVSITDVSVTSNYNGYGVDCYGNSTGSASVSATGGTEIYTFIWSNGETNNSTSGLTAGIYSVTVSDENGCSASSSSTITEPTPVEVPTIAVTSDYTGFDIDCFGNSTGSLSVSTTGGVSGYTFSWSNGETSDNINGLAAGEYFVTVTDDNGCSNSSSISISEPEVVSITDISVTSDYNGYGVDCFGNSTGNGTVSVAGGASGYSYEWSNGQTASNLSSVSAGVYSVTVSDLNGCSVSASINFTQPTALNSTGIVTDVLCNGIYNGGVDLSINGGVLPYAFTWFNGTTAEDITGLNSGTKTVTITDANLCSISNAFEIKEESPILVTSNFFDVVCYGQSNGQAYFNISGGLEPYTYQWSNGLTENYNTKLTKGAYSITVTDSYSCTKVLEFSINQPDTLTVIATPDLKSNGHHISYTGGDDGLIEAVVDGGTEPYTYTWSNGETSPIVAQLEAGTYALNVTDDKGCAVQAIVFLTEPSTLEMPTGFTPNNDGANDYFVVRGLEAYADNDITVFNRWGNVVFQTTNYNNQWNGKNNDSETLPDGTYFVILKVRTTDLEKTLEGYVDLRR